MNHSPEIWPGWRYPVGANYDGTGTNFSLFSEVAQRVELCLFDEEGNESRADLPEVDAFFWHGYVPGVEPGQRYGYRVHGPYDPSLGLRCNPSKLLLDPYAKAVDSDVRWDWALYGYEFGNPERMSHADSAPFMPKGVVINPYFDWGADRPPNVAYHHSIIYEAQVRGLTRRHPGLPEELRGTYAGIGHPVMVDYLTTLGVTAIELMPVHQFIHDQYLIDSGLRNYWGYNTIGFFAPYHGYAASGHLGQQVQEFRGMVKALHAAGIEVILDVVYNHTAEGNEMGPTLSFRGIDNVAYYRLDEDNPQYYLDYTGCGNSLNASSPHMLQLIMDSLRYWITEMHVDGFRFDLAATLAREFYEVDRLSTFFEVVQQDPVISMVKLIAEPWDIGPGGYQVGNFPPLWAEWNGRYRDATRDFWRGQPSTLGEFADRLCGSADLYQDDGRRPMSSINFVTCHDGFTLTDLVSYNTKHNDANGEGNRDGESYNRSWNCGIEGQTDDAAILEVRGKQRRNFMATLMLSQGVPMISHGDELGRTQRGNNNAYCHDSELTWVDWDAVDETMLEFTRSLIAFRLSHRAFLRRRFFTGRPSRRAAGNPLPDVQWFTPDGRQMTEDDWSAQVGGAVTLFVNGEGIRERGPRGERRTDSSFLLCFNAHHEWLEFATPRSDYASKWCRVIDTSQPIIDDDAVIAPGASLWVPDRCLVVLEQVP